MYRGSYVAEITCLHEVAIFEFRRTSEVCNKKFNLLFKLYKIDKLTNDISMEEMHECKFYESIDQFFSCYYICFHIANNHRYHCTIILMRCKLLQCHNYNNNISNYHKKTQKLQEFYIYDHS
jgi:hypothetical protein